MILWSRGETFVRASLSAGLTEVTVFAHPTFAAATDADLGQHQKG